MRELEVSAFSQPTTRFCTLNSPDPGERLENQLILSEYLTPSPLIFQDPPQQNASGLNHTLSLFSSWHQDSIIPQMDIVQSIGYEKVQIRLIGL